MAEKERGPTAWRGEVRLPLHLAPLNLFPQCSGTEKQDQGLLPGLQSLMLELRRAYYRRSEADPRGPSEFWEGKTSSTQYVTT